jgi:hypothetical protein
VSSTVNEMTLRTIQGHPYDVVSTSIGVLGILLLLTLLVIQELWNAKAGAAGTRRIAIFYSITVPLCMSFGVVVGLRVLSLLRN